MLLFLHSSTICGWFCWNGIFSLRTVNTFIAVFCIGWRQGTENWLALMVKTSLPWPWNGLGLLQTNSKLAFPQRIIGKVRSVWNSSQQGRMSNRFRFKNVSFLSHQIPLLDSSFVSISAKRALCECLLLLSNPHAYFNPNLQSYIVFDHIYRCERYFLAGGSNISYTSFLPSL